MHIFNCTFQQFSIPYFSVQGESFSENLELILVILAIHRLKQNLDAKSFINNTFIQNFTLTQNTKPNNVVIVDVYSCVDTKPHPVVFWLTEKYELLIIDPLYQRHIYHLQRLIHVHIRHFFCSVDIDNLSRDHLFYDFDQTRITPLDVCISISHHLLQGQVFEQIKMLKKSKIELQHKGQTKIHNLLTRETTQISDPVHTILKGVKQLSNRKTVNKRLRNLPESVESVSFDNLSPDNYDQFVELIENNSEYLYLLELIRYPITYDNLFILEELTSDSDFWNLHTDFKNFKRESWLHKSKMESFGETLCYLFQLLQTYFHHNLLE
jgi:hypothetical protein